ncbi:5'-deoxynucleotidase HDDC2-like isoform X1 [Portunus trituberculatus]|uniref:5'-deoxynucleotidase HDDC2-like isoform X1 n=1 Tax=Portunus trituberculatus TaxID=210409 RepID=UPI001E1D21B0|nr:5'-deoxynucleotidase HDDC2-like isoform X1 [Portunus trituberculatus]XP_045131620.1 5'-deoxynucleotidase HDDC2-like isoform X1 [Portunus trituberculatus]
MAANGSSASCLAFLKQIGRLKHLKRTGWVLRKVNEPETVSGHMYRMAIMSFLFDDDDGVDRDRVMKMSLVHDMAESTVGDLTPHCGVSDEDKHQREVAAMESFRSLLGQKAGTEMYDLFMEYEEQKTKEAKLVKDLDKFDMILQAFEYETDQDRAGTLEEFFKSTEGKFTHPKIIKWIEQLYKERDEKLKSY